MGSLLCVKNAFRKNLLKSRSRSPSASGDVIFRKKEVNDSTTDALALCAAKSLTAIAKAM